MIDTTSWSSVEHTLAVALLGLTDHQFITLSAPAAPDPPRKRFWWSRGTPAPVPFTQALRMDATLYTECVGSTSFGGHYPWSPEAETALAELGWEHVPHPLGERAYSVYFGDYLTGDQAGRAARLLVATMRDVAGLADSRLLEVTSG